MSGPCSGPLHNCVRNFAGSVSTEQIAASDTRVSEACRNCSDRQAVQACSDRHLACQLTVFRAAVPVASVSDRLWNSLKGWLPQTKYDRDDPGDVTLSARHTVSESSVSFRLCCATCCCVSMHRFCLNGIKFRHHLGPDETV